MSGHHHDDAPAAPTGSPARCSCGGERPPPRHHVDITTADHTVIITSDAPQLADVVAAAYALHDRTKRPPREASGFAAGTAPAVAEGGPRPPADTPWITTTDGG